MQSAFNESGKTVKAAKPQAYGEDQARAILGLPARSQQVKIMQDMQAFHKEVQELAAAQLQARKLGIPVNTVGGSFSNLPTGPKAPKAPAAPKDLDLGKTTGEAEKLRKEFDKLSVSGRDVNAMARGLSSGFGVLQNVWGNLIPLMAGAALSNAFMQTAKMGMEVSYTLGIIGALGEASSSQVGTLTNEMIRLGYEGPRGPREIAEAMQTLTLAGLKANEVLAVTGTVLNFSTAGTTTIQNAADVLVSVTTAFGTGAEGFTRSADIIMRAAADSKASVESFGEAMKTASVVGETFQASQEDVALLIGYLANLGIQGTAAGTAIRNMYTDMAGRSGQAIRLMKHFNVEFKTAEGGIVDVHTQMEKLKGVLDKYDAKSQLNIIQALYGERGSKAAIAAWQAFNTQATDSSKYANKLAEDMARLQETAGDTAIAAAQLGQTTKKVFEAAGASWQTTMFKAYQAIEPQLYMMGKAFEEAFSSPEAVSGLTTLASAVANIGSAIAENITPIIQLTALWAAGRLGIMALSAVVGTAATAMQWYTGVKLANAAASARLTAASGSAAVAVAGEAAATAAASRAGVAKLGTMAGFLRVLPVVGNVIAGVSLAWLLYDGYIKKAGVTAEDYANTKADAVLTALRNEAAKLDEVNDLRATGVTLLEAEALAKDRATRAEQTYGLAKVVSERRDDVERLRKELAAASVAPSPDTAGGAYVSINRSAVEKLRLQNVKDLDAKVLAAEGEAAQAQLRLESSEAQLREAQEDIRKKQKRQDDLTLAEAKARADALNAKLPKGTGVFNLADFQDGLRASKFGGKGGGKHFIDQQRDGELDAIKAWNDKEFALAQDAFNKEKALQDARRSGELISEGKYMADAMNLAISYEQKQIALLEESQRKYEEASAKRLKQMAADRAAAPEKMRGSYDDMISKETNERDTQRHKTDTQIQKVKADAVQRTELAYINLEAVVGKLMKTDREYWNDQTRNREKEDATYSLEQAYKNLNQSLFSNEQAEYAAEKAKLASTQATDAHLVKLREQLAIFQDMEKVQSAELLSGLAAGTLSDEAVSTMVEGLARVRKTVLDNERVISEAVIKGDADAATAAQRAFARARTEMTDKLTTDVSTALVDGLMNDDLKGAAKAMKKMLQDELLAKPLTVGIKGVLNKIVDGIGLGDLSAALGAFGGTGSGGIGSGTSNLMGMASNASSIYSLTTGKSAMSTLGGLFGAGSAATGTGLTLGSAGLGITAGATSTGLGLSAGAAKALGAGIGSSIPAGSMVVGGTALGGAPVAATGVAAGTGIMGSMTAALAAVPVWGWALAAFAAVVGSMDFSGETRIGGQYGVAFNGEVENQRRGETYTNDGQSYKNLGAEGQALVDGVAYRLEGAETPHAENDVKKVVSATAAGINTLLGDLGSASALTGFWAGMETSEKGRGGVFSGGSLSTGEMFGESGQGDNYKGTLYEKWSADSPDAEQALADFSLDLKQVTLQALQAASDIPSTVKRLFEGIEIEELDDSAADELLRRVNELVIASKQLSEVFVSMGLTYPKEDTIDFTAYLADAIGGFEALASGLDSFYGSYYSEAERMEALSVAMQKAVGELGFEIDPRQGQEAKDAFRKATEDALEGGNAALGATLLKLNQSFATAADYAEGLKEQVEDLAVVMKTAAEDADKQMQLRIAILRQQGNELDAVAQERKNELKAMEGYSSETIELQLALWKLEDSMNGAKLATDSMYNSTNALAQKLADSASSALSAMDTAGTLLDRIAEAGGDKSGAYGKQREDRLWAAMGTGSYKQQIDLAEQLTSIVLDRVQTEVQSAEKMTSLYRALRDSIEATRLGSLSPLVLGEKLAEAGKQFNEAVAKAANGDEAAAQEAISLRSTYLELAQRYYAASDDYTNIFNSTEAALAALGTQAQSEAERLASLSQSSLSQLDRLRAVTEQALQAATQDYADSSAELAKQLDVLSSMDGGIGSMTDLLAGLPAELAALLNPLLEGKGGTTSPYSNSQVAEWMKTTQRNNPGLMMDQLQQQALSNGATAGQLSQVTGNLYSDAEVWALIQDGKRNYPNYSMAQLAQLGKAQYGVEYDQFTRVINGSHRTGLKSVPFDGYIGELHAKERVLTAKEAAAYKDFEDGGIFENDSFDPQVVALLGKIANLMERNLTAGVDGDQMLAEVVLASGSNTSAQVVKAVRTMASKEIKPK